MLRGIVQPRGVDSWTLRFAAGEQVRVSITTGDARRLGCIAQDAAGNLVDLDAATTGRCHLTWVPGRTGNYRIMIRNGDSVPSAYQVVAR